jgi:hypothetical protein
MAPGNILSSRVNSSAQHQNKNTKKRRTAHRIVEEPAVMELSALFQVDGAEGSSNISGCQRHMSKSNTTSLGTAMVTVQYSRAGYIAEEILDVMHSPSPSLQMKQLSSCIQKLPTFCNSSTPTAQLLLLSSCC